MKSQLSIEFYLYRPVHEHLKGDFPNLMFKFKYYFPSDLTIAIRHSSINILPSIFVTSFSHIYSWGTLLCFQTYSLNHIKHLKNFNCIDLFLQRKVCLFHQIINRSFILYFNLIQTLNLFLSHWPWSFFQVYCITFGISCSFDTFSKSYSIICLNSSQKKIKIFFLHYQIIILID